MSEAMFRELNHVTILFSYFPFPLKGSYKGRGKWATDLSQMSAPLLPVTSK